MRVRIGPKPDPNPAQVMAWFWLEYVQSLQFIGLLFNTSVHVVMYYYYFRRVLGWPVWWKRNVTTFQIVQARNLHPSPNPNPNPDPDPDPNPNPSPNQFGTSAVCGMVTLAMLASGADCAGPRVLTLTLTLNLTSPSPLL